VKHTKKNKFAEELFDAYDDGPETHRIINGKPCVYWTEGKWISKEGVELDEDRDSRTKQDR
jgi:hypothetical protein